MSIAEHDRPGLDLLGYLLFLLVCAAVCAALATMIHPHGTAPYVLAVILGVYAGLVATSCFVRGYRRARQATEQ